MNVSPAELLEKIRRDEQGNAHVMGLSGGKDSTALALMHRLLHPDVPMTYICTPTGDELPEMEAHWERLEEPLDAPLYRIRVPDKEGGFLTLHSLIEHFGALPNHRQRWCTRMLKIEPTKALMVLLAHLGQEGAQAILYVGLRADEEERRGLFWSGLTRFPLREWGWDEDDVWAFLKRHGVQIPRRTDCSLCYHQRLIEWKMLDEERPDLYDAGVAHEVATGHTFRSPKRDTWPAGLADLREAFRSGRPVRGEDAYRERLERGESPCRVCSL